MSVVKTRTDAPESEAVFRHHSRQDVFFPFSECRDAFLDLQEVVTEAVRVHDQSKGSPQWLDVGGSTFLETEDILGLLKPVYTIGNEQELRSWLERYPGSKHVLLWAPSVIANYFPEASLRLEVRTDPEIDDDRRLGIYIQTGLDSKEAVEQLTALDSEWGDHLHALTGGGLLLNVESKS